MKTKVESQESEREGNLDIDGQATHRPWAGGEYGERKNRVKKRPAIGARINTQSNHGKTSTYSSNSRLTSFLRGHSLAQPDSFKATESTIFNQLAQKYVPRGSPTEKMREEMQLVLQGKKSQIQVLRVLRDELKFISYNNPYDMPIKISLAVLKQKARAQQRIKDMMLLLQKDIKQIEFQFNTMTDYYNYISNAVKSNGQEDLIIDTQEEEKLMVQNLEKQTNHLFRELKEEDKKNAKEIKNIQEQIAVLRVYIKQKEDTIRDLKSKICTLHIKLHSRAGSSSKDKNLSLSIRKFITQQNNSIQEAFIGNSSFKNYSKEVLEKIAAHEDLHKLLFYFQPKKQLITFKCFYKDHEGKLHALIEEPFQTHNLASPPKQKKQAQMISVRVKYLLSIKFYFKSKIVGVQCRLKTQKGTQLQKIGNCESNLQHQLLTLINKKIVTVGSYWHQKDLIGVGIWFCGKWGGEYSRASSKQSNDSSNKFYSRATKRNPATRVRQEQNNEYYQT